MAKNPAVLVLGDTFHGSRVQKKPATNPVITKTHSATKSPGKPQLLQIPLLYPPLFHHTQHAHLLRTAYNTLPRSMGHLNSINKKSSAQAPLQIRAETTSVALGRIRLTPQEALSSGPYDLLASPGAMLTFAQRTPYLLKKGISPEAPTILPRFLFIALNFM